MDLRIKIFIYWLIVVSVSYVIARIDHVINGRNIYFKYYESFWSGIYHLIHILGCIVIAIYLFCELSNFYFKGEFIQP